MITRKMNHRVTFFREIGGQNEDGEVISPSRKNLYTCWAEVAKTSLRDFQEGANQTANKKAKGIVSSTFVITQKDLSTVQIMLNLMDLTTISCLSMWMNRHLIWTR